MDFAEGGGGFFRDFGGGCEGAYCIVIFSADSGVIIVLRPRCSDRKSHSTPSSKVMKMSQLRLPVLGLVDVSTVHIMIALEAS